MLKKYFGKFILTYWKNKRLRFTLCLIEHYMANQNELILTIFNERKLTDITGYEDDWGTNWLKHFILWRRINK